MAMTKTKYGSHEINRFLENAVVKSSLVEGYLNLGVSFLYNERFDNAQKFTHSSSIHP